MQAGERNLERRHVFVQTHDHISRIKVTGDMERFPPGSLTDVTETVDGQGWTGPGTMDERVCREIDAP